MNETLKKLIDNFVELFQTGAYSEAVQQLQYFVQKIPHDQLVQIMSSMPKKDLIEFMSALTLAWKSANELSKAEAKKIMDAALMIVRALLAIVLGQE